ncbi:galactose oxidase [Dyadobacter chenwenxiniae]|uniref:Galactose oxidase n=1 Tax=Dyadobacter chenwenxiniae TaxID=2906456 RepID=A0A9X1PMX0_9BACT|nr:galactose oxidase [Dyadobacter chenwenxiniae]MCF0062924.1 galactose oxidase [Dyadobacter chenwenxiniae]UON84902.1 galactose oxidase [Dyadobacter chenwenxiniae]
MRTLPERGRLNMCTRLKIVFVLLAFQFFYGMVNLCPAQSYGLGFESYESVQDKRTGLDLSPDKTFCFDNNFELSFEVSFLKHKKNYFGYIVRLIENDRQNIDILYDNSSLNKDRFKVVIGDKFSKIAFDIDEIPLYENWNSIRLIFNKDAETLTVFSGTRQFRQAIALEKNGCFKILFGANKYKNFNTTDVPPMKIRNIAIKESGEEKYHWNLDEMSGAKAIGTAKNTDGLVANPLWIKKMHYEWQPLQTFVIQGPARVTCDQTTGMVYIVGTDTLTTHRISSNQVKRIPYQSGKQPLFMDNQVLYEKSTNSIYNLFINEKQVSHFDTLSSKWDKSDLKAELKTHFLHANKFYSKPDSTIYILGGYGHLEYKNTIQKYHLGTGNWSQTSPQDSTFGPRYLAAAGAASDGAYLMGGYGSVTGRQILNPRNWYDLIFFNAKTRLFKKIYDLKIPQDDFVFANSMIVKEKENAYYALIFPKDKFNSALQLITGSLSRPEYKVVGSKIPFEFVDTESFADLFFDESTGRFVAVTLFRTDQNQTKVSIYSLFSPPLETAPAVKQASAKSENMLCIIGALVAVIAGVYFYRRRKPSQAAAKVVPAPIEPFKPAEVTFSPAPITEFAKKSIETKAMPLHSSIMLFGNLQLFDDQGTEITRLFTPLLKELFLVILLHSVRREGISSEKLKELLWFDKSSESARNNRAVNIAKLKGILDKLKWCHISKESGYWRVNIDYEQIHVDYAEYLKLVSDKRLLSKQDIFDLSQISKRGTFLADLEYEWLDSFKSEISNEIVDAYLRYATSVKIADDPEFMIKVANYIFYFDPVNEEAMTIKCKALALLGKHSLAKTTFENFAREYMRIYGEEFRKDMPEVLHS